MLSSGLTEIALTQGDLDFRLWGRQCDNITCYHLPNFPLSQNRTWIHSITCLLILYKEQGSGLGARVRGEQGSHSFLPRRCQINTQLQKH